MSDRFSFALVVPTLNAGSQWRLWWQALSEQSTRPMRVLVVDSASTDDTVAIAREAGAEVHPVARGEFNHGGTRRWAADLAMEVDVLVFLTQDAVLASPDSLRRLLAVFEDERVGVAYGRQLPRPGAGPIEAHARLFNYPERSHRMDSGNASRYGIKAPFLSNSFSAYRVQALQAVGGFPQRVIQSEDMYIGARMLQQGAQVAYVGDACVFHSHAYGWRQDFQRYFDIGVFHAQEPWIREAFGGASSEGMRFVRSELRYLLKHAPGLMPSALLRTVLKLLGFRLGLRQAVLPPSWRRRLSMQKYYWTSSAPGPSGS